MESEEAAPSGHGDKERIRNTEPENEERTNDQPNVSFFLQYFNNSMYIGHSVVPYRTHSEFSIPSNV